jgi:putative PIN family toxin of toxin-antitoxin system
MKGAVIDTNVLVSGLLSRSGSPAQILNLLVNKRIAAYYDHRILEEYRDVLSRAQFGFTKAEVDGLLDGHSG